MQLITQVQMPSPDFHLSESSVIMMLGSCFAENIGKIFISNKFKCDANPFGVLYNPMSIFEVLSVVDNNDFDFDKYLFSYNGIWGSWMHSTLFSSESKKDCVDSISLRYEEACVNLKAADVLLITFGTNYYYTLKDSGLVVSNCHKCPASYFNEMSASSAQIVEKAIPVLSALIDQNPKLKIVLTVSPYRYKKYGFHKSQSSKANLLLATEILCQMFPSNVSYFPAYEIVLDELRDYRYYAEDMLHPSDLAIKYIWEKFSSVYLTSSAVKMMEEWLPISNILNHRIQFESTEKQKMLYKDVLEKIKVFSNSYPFVNVDNELLYINKMLNHN